MYDYRYDIVVVNGKLKALKGYHTTVVIAVQSKAGLAPAATVYEHAKCKCVVCSGNALSYTKLV